MSPRAVYAKGNAKCSGTLSQHERNAVAISAHSDFSRHVRSMQFYTRTRRLTGSDFALFENR